MRGALAALFLGAGAFAQQPPQQPCCPQPAGQPCRPCQPQPPSQGQPSTPAPAPAPAPGPAVEPPCPDPAPGTTTGGNSPGGKPAPLLPSKPAEKPRGAATTAQDPELPPPGPSEGGVPAPTGHGNPPSTTVEKVCGPDVTNQLAAALAHIHKRLDGMGAAGWSYAQKIQWLAENGGSMDFDPAPCDKCPYDCPDSVTLCKFCVKQGWANNIVFGLAAGTLGVGSKVQEAAGHEQNIAEHGLPDRVWETAGYAVGNALAGKTITPDTLCDALINTKFSAVSNSLAGELYSGSTLVDSKLPCPLCPDVPKNYDKDFSTDDWTDPSGGDAGLYHCQAHACDTPKGDTKTSKKTVIRSKETVTCPKCGAQFLRFHYEDLEVDETPGEAHTCKLPRYHGGAHSYTEYGGKCVIRVERVLKAWSGDNAHDCRPGRKPSKNKD